MMSVVCEEATVLVSQKEDARHFARHLKHRADMNMRPVNLEEISATSTRSSRRTEDKRQREQIQLRIFDILSGEENDREVAHAVAIKVAYLVIRFEVFAKASLVSGGFKRWFIKPSLRNKLIRGILVNEAL
jgi:hypothetical protein